MEKIEKSREIDKYIAERVDDLMNKDDETYMSKGKSDKGFSVYYQEEKHYVELIKDVILELKVRGLI